jgi:hypothetical protein
MRARAVQTFERAISAFGCDNTESGGKSFGRTALPATDGERAMSLVVGCLLEQIGSDRVQMDNFDDDWGTEEERLDLVTSCSRCLAASLASCGGFLSISIRSLIESIAVSALSSLNEMEKSSNSILDWAPAKISILELACSCATTPWQDGASSSIIEQLTAVAKQLEDDMDISVSMCAKSAHRMCDVVGVPRAPALVYISRAATSGTSSNEDPVSIAASIKASQEETLQARKKEEEEELERKMKRDQKRNLEEQKRLEQAAKRQKSLPDREKEVKTASVASKVHQSEGEEIPKVVNDREVGPRDGATMSTEASEERVDVHVEADNGKSDKPNDAKESLDETEETSTRYEEISANSVGNIENKGEKIEGNDDNDSDDDDELPEIFAHGPDSDEEE